MTDLRFILTATLAVVGIVLAVVLASALLLAAAQ